MESPTLLLGPEQVRLEDYDDALKSKLIERQKENDKEYDDSTEWKKQMKKLQKEGKLTEFKLKRQIYYKEYAKEVLSDPVRHERLKKRMRNAYQRRKDRMIANGVWDQFLKRVREKSKVNWRKKRRATEEQNGAFVDRRYYANRKSEEKDSKHAKRLATRREKYKKSQIFFNEMKSLLKDYEQFHPQVDSIPAPPTETDPAPPYTQWSVSMRISPTFQYVTDTTAEQMDKLTHIFTIL